MSVNGSKNYTMALLTDSKSCLLLQALPAGITPLSTNIKVDISVVKMSPQWKGARMLQRQPSPFPEQRHSRNSGTQSQECLHSVYIYDFCSKGPSTCHRWPSCSEMIFQRWKTTWRIYANENVRERPTRRSRKRRTPKRVHWLHGRNIIVGLLRSRSTLQIRQNILEYNCNEVLLPVNIILVHGQLVGHQPLSVCVCVSADIAILLGAWWMADYETLHVCRVPWCQQCVKFWWLPRDPIFLFKKR